MKSLIRTNGNLFPAIPSLLEDFFTKDWLDSSMNTWRTAGATLPAVNVMETNDAYTIEVAAPGMKRKDFNLELQNNVLTISASVANKKEENDDGYMRREFNYQSFQRSFSLPEHKVEGDKITARYDDGILSVSIPKREEAKVRPAKQITVS